MSSETAIHLYAEHLLNIQALTLTATLSTESTPLTTAKLSTDANSLTLTHENDSATIRLPTEIKGGGDATLELPKKTAKELELRLRLEEKDPQNSFMRHRSAVNGAAEDDNWVPWTATSLTNQEGAFQCRNCAQILLSVRSRPKDDQDQANVEESITQWRDLPNENWAEMMDFWHCHKPDVKESDTSVSLDMKGYAAGNKLQAVNGVGLVDLSSFLVAESDIKHVKTSDNTTLLCARCAAEVGIPDPCAEGFKLWKWALQFVPGALPTSLLQIQHRAHPLQRWLAALFLAVIENQGVRKLAVFDARGSATQGLLLWIFTPDLMFSSSHQDAVRTRRDPTRAMKVFWQDLRCEEEGLYANSTSVEEAKLPSPLFAALGTALQESRLLLPSKGWEFRGWNVGLLQRFHGDETD